MRPRLSTALFALTILLVNAAFNVQDASSHSLERLLSRRQSGEGEQEATTPKSQDGTQAQAPAPSQAAGGQSNGGNGAAGTQSPRLYPDLVPQQPNFLPPFGAPPVNGFRPAAFVPFGSQMLNPAPNQPAPFGRMPMQPRLLTAAERLQSQSFADGLGRRLLSMVGINVGDKEQATGETSTPASNQQGTRQAQQPNRGVIENTMRALQNSTVLQQLNKGINSMYGSLSKMYNSTVQEQLDLLQERIKAETQNSTSGFQQRLAQRVPVLFKDLTSKIAEAQSRLNNVWQDIAQAGTNNYTNKPSAISRPKSAFFAFGPRAFDDTDGGAGGQSFFNPGPNDFFSQIGSSLGAPPTDQQHSSASGPNQGDLGARLRDMWHNQIQPQISSVRNHIARAWRDLELSGQVLPLGVNHRSRMANNNSGPGSNASSDLVDSILKEVDINNSEYSLVEPKSDGNQGDSASAPGSGSAKQENGIKLSPEMQDRLVAMQREINQLWMGLSNSLQGALANVRRTLNPRKPGGIMWNPSYGTTGPGGSVNQQAQEVDPAQNEIDDKIRGLSKLQKNVDMVHDALHQQQRETQHLEHQTFGDRFRGLFNNIDINQWSDRVGNSLNQFGNAVGNMWNQLPNRWDDFMANVRPQQQDTQAKLKAATSTTTTTSPVST